MLREILTVIVLFALDAAWLFANASQYQKVVAQVQKTRMKVNYLGAVLSYIGVLLALFVIAIPAIKRAPRQDLWTCLKIGGLLGFVIYLVYNGTNYAIFGNYSLLLSAIDTLWGTLLFTTVCYFYFTLNLGN